MSGGIDSTVAAMLLIEQGYQLVGVTFRPYDTISTACMEKQTGCCSVDAIFEAKQIANKFGFNHHVLDTRELFKQTVINNFIAEYLAGRTPNPCVMCNTVIKWGELINKADELGCNYIATGHYAQIVNVNNRYALKKGIDKTKDQSYFLWTLTQDNLKRTLFPLGNLTKQQVRDIAFEKGFVKLSQKRESQEICFIPDNDYRKFLAQNVPGFEQNYKPGYFVDTLGKKLGMHKGYPNYTIGQRKGLDIAVGHPLYVVKIDPQTNTIVLGNRDELSSKVFYADNLNIMATNNIEPGTELLTKIRYRNAGGLARIWPQNNLLKVEYYNNVDAITPGQSVVFYNNDIVYGGGIIKHVGNFYIS